MPLAAAEAPRCHAPGAMAALMTFALRPGLAARYTQLTQTPRNLIFSPDGSQLGVTMHSDPSTKPMAELPAKSEGVEWAAPAEVIDRTKGKAPIEIAHILARFERQDGTRATP